MAPLRTETPAWGYNPREDERIKDVALMKRYAAEQLRNPGHDYQIALGLIDVPNVASLAVNIWNNEPVVIRERLRLMEEYGERAELPTKETVMREVLAIGRADKHSVNERLKAYQLYSEMNGYTGRTAGTAPSVQIFANKVMAIKDHGTDEQWEARSAQQQADLVQAARDDAKRSETHH